MTPKRTRYRTVLCLALAFGCARAAEVPSAPVRLIEAVASSTSGEFSAARAIDGSINETSRWTSGRSEGPSWLEVRLSETTSLLGLHVYTGRNASAAITDFKVQFQSDGSWVDIPSAAVAGNRASALALAFDDAVAVRTDRLRLWITATPDGYARIEEIVVWPSSVRSLPGLPNPSAGASRVPLIYLNQSGFTLGSPKRFTAPTLVDGTRFEVRPAEGGAPLFSGTSVISPLSIRSAIRASSS
ncbi:MAG: type domain [Verrucomicrobiota bacterium]